MKDDAVLSQPCEKATVADARWAQDLLGYAGRHRRRGVLGGEPYRRDEGDRRLSRRAGRAARHVQPQASLGLGAFKAVEGCLTRDEETAVTRFERAKISYHEAVDGELKLRKQDFQGWTAQMLQHDRPLQRQASLEANGRTARRNGSLPQRRTSFGRRLFRLFSAPKTGRGEHGRPCAGGMARPRRIRETKRAGRMRRCAPWRTTAAGARRDNVAWARCRARSPADTVRGFS